MGRRVSSGVVGTSGFGSISVVNSTLSTTTTNEDLILDPDGTGRVLIDTDLQLNAQSDLRWADGDSSNWLAFQAPAVVAANITWTLPSTDGSASQVLTTNGSGTLSWSTTGTTVSTTTSSSTFYPILTTATSGSVTSTNVSNSNFTFQPSTGTLSATLFNETSSIALKENLRPIDGALNLILSLNSYVFDRKDGSTKNEPGLVAEEVNTIIPNVVTKDADGNPQGINYSRLSAYLIEAVKSLKTELDQLKSIK